ncbi:L-threonylcarbamoyladenylate synthase [Sphingomonas sp. KRR8]|uniref:L-threonylcarbamoyladenylate synthase n=1 Tax=Sphingomonas sp. KRR8 TaxID=2942996 RepID=UPI002021AA84|nr:L-threonylcarbamoyladenylate synthase [Sphingomonas sp. KRR8]URD61717.1 L-threonylcarbamoyladenylate synthase [Sphingomonas sp. KRR8]
MTGEGTEIRAFDEAALAQATDLILAGQLVAVPTETVYGLAADATNGEAVARIYAAKGRPSFNPLIVHVPDLASAEKLGEFDAAARRLAEAHWPGPLTLVVPLLDDAGISSLVTAGLPSIALRVPAHPVMQALLRATGRPLAAPSANASGRISPTTAQHVFASLSGRIALILDGGPTERGLESTIVAVTDGRLRLLRPGPLLIEGAERTGSGDIEAPGMMASHYAPTKPVRLNATQRRDGEWLIGFGAITGDDTLSASGDLTEAAARLFACLHRADAQPVDAIAVAPVPDEGLGTAINDRLRRAAA